MSSILLDKAIVITGSGRGIGEALARHAAVLGARVVINDIDADAARAVAKSIEQAGHVAIAQPGDISRFEEAKQLIECCVSSFGRIDGLVNNAGLLGLSRIDEISPSHLEKMLAVNIAGTAYCAHHAARHMIAAGKGSIVNVTSGAQMGLAAASVYAGSKGAVASFTYCWALELKEFGIRVNAVSPLGATRMIDVELAYRSAHGEFTAHKGIVQHAEANAPLICFLLSDRAKGVNGQILRLNGRSLSLVSHPAICWPIEKDFWDIEGIADAFDTQLRARQIPLGIQTARIDFPSSTSRLDE